MVTGLVGSLLLHTAELPGLICVVVPQFLMVTPVAPGFTLMLITSARPAPLLMVTSSVVFFDVQVVGGKVVLSSTITANALIEKSVRSTNSMIFIWLSLSKCPSSIISKRVSWRRNAIKTKINRHFQPS